MSNISIHLYYDICLLLSPSFYGRKGNISSQEDCVLVFYNSYVLLLLICYENKLLVQIKKVSN